MILIDSNIPMYLIGAAHPNKPAARRLLEASIAAGEELCADVEVFQEILHRYTAIDRREAIEPAFELLRRVVDVVYPIEFADVERARRLVATWGRLSARDALHVAVMQGRDIDRVMSFNTGFDGIAGITRVS